ncbi:MAG: hypothetical protein HYR96_10330 [Deltaproteobacteria bacterium]|nr:hypothetical protein [Deltaproteobacteria bacterium]MBI3295627.1 hypothetical protein [Deltaproteobacteria bacterium]
MPKPMLMPHKSPHHETDIKPFLVDKLRNYAGSFAPATTYLRVHKVPVVPKDLELHPVLCLNVHHRVRFRSNENRLGNFVKQKPIACDDGAFLKELALKDCGVLVRSIWDVKEDLATGRLIQVLKHHRLETFGFIHAVVPGKRFLAPRVRAIFNLLVERAALWK